MADKRTTPEQPTSPEPASTEHPTQERTIHAGEDYFERIEGDVYIGAPPSGDSVALREAYLNRLFATCSQVFLAGIDRKAAGRDAEACLNLSAIYTPLLTISAEHDEGRLKNAHEGRERRLSALDQLNRHARVVVLGDPGSGKSTFVNFVTMCLAGELLRDPNANIALLTAPLPNDEGADEEEPQLWQHGPLLPVRIILRDFAAEGLPPDGKRATAGHLWEFIVKMLQETAFSDYAPYLRTSLLETGALVLFDGLDEVPEAEQRRAQIKQAVEDFATTFRKCRILVTSRTYAYQQQEWQLSGFAETVLALFSQGHIRRFVDRWYTHSAPLLGMRPDDARQRAELLKRAVFGSDRLYNFAERPLLLTLMASLHAWRGGSLPEKREELYNDAVELLLDWWENRKVKHAEGQLLSLIEVLKLGREGMIGLRRLISVLAYEAHAAQSELVGAADIAEDRLAGELMRLSQDKQVNPLRLVEYLRDRTGLLISHGVGVYTFPHRTFQEYLAACHLTEDQNNYPDNVAELARHDPNRWREVVLLAGAKAARGAASTIWSLAEALCYHSLDDPNRSAGDAWGALLAGQTLVETANLEQISDRHRPKVNRIRDWLLAILTEQQPPNTPFPAVERALAGNILAVLSDPRPDVRLPEDGLPEIAWCDVPAGSFLMGSDPEKDEDSRIWEEEQPQHTVHLSAYQISRYPVTNAQYQAFVEDGGYTERWQKCWDPEGWEWKEKENISAPESYGGEFDLPNHPVVGVSWYEAVAFCNWLTQRLREQGELLDGHSIRLPTEAEWGKAARGNDGRVYPWGDEIIPELANYNDTGLGATSTVGCFPRGKSSYGCEEMAGNVWEWCLDWYDENYYSDSPKENPQGPESGSFRVIRGGIWGDDARNCRSAFRFSVGPGSRGFFIGFRLLRTP
ncbi:MAG: SUMF1/EgtB/PvdO family nonheme iron enzyme [Rhodobacteraceae bacterium]|nr:SUMF1/EgtB/PvdO family nonheme iron enzyme [Paracoccaceae bacterium]